jgi:hypothetical protein
MPRATRATLAQAPHVSVLERRGSHVIEGKTEGILMGAQPVEGPRQVGYVKRAELAPVPGSLSRADVADFLVTAADSADWVGKAVQLGG